LSAADLPITAAFFSKVFYDGNRAIGAAKAHFNRPRPFVTDPDIKPIVDQPANASYLRGHATFAYESAILLAIIVPEKARAIFDRGAAYAHSRVVAGVHYPTDLEAGRISATVIDSVFLRDPRFLADLARSRAELRKALGLSTQDHAASIPETQPAAQ
jgi:acid phosphatase (class A)